MFKSVANKLAHNTHVPSLGGNKDLRNLQDLITLEKAIVASSQKFALDIAKAAEALKHWGHLEGDDLGDIATASTTLLLHIAGSFNQFSNIEGTIREQMKAVRTREEALDEVKRRRRATSSKADDAERRLSKMGPENKNYQGQMDLLNRLKEEIRGLDTDIANEETAISDFKRHSLRTWLGNKFGGIQDFSEKGLIISDIGKNLLTLIPMDRSQPGIPRPYYTGHGQAEALVTQAQLEVQEVTFSPEPGTGRRLGVPGQSAPGTFAATPHPLPQSPQHQPQSQIPPQQTGPPHLPPDQPRPPSWQSPLPPEPAAPGHGLFAPRSPEPITPSPSLYSPYHPGTITEGDRPGETLLSHTPVTQNTTYQAPPQGPGVGFAQPQVTTEPTPLPQQAQQQYAPPLGPPPGHESQSTALMGHGYTPPQRHPSFVGLPPLRSQTGPDLGLGKYLASDAQLPPLPDQGPPSPPSQPPQSFQQQQQQQPPQPYPQQQQQQQQYPQQQYLQQQYPQQPGGYGQQQQQLPPQGQFSQPHQHVPYPELNQYPSSPPQHIQPMPPSNEYSHNTYHGPATQPLANLNEFGAYAPSGGYAPRTSSLRVAGDGSSSPTATSPPSRFGTFPMKGGPRPPPSASSYPPTPTSVAPQADPTPAPIVAPAPAPAPAPIFAAHGQEDSFSTTVAEALGQEWSQRVSYAQSEGGQYPFIVQQPQDAATTNGQIGQRMSQGPNPDATTSAGGPPPYDRTSVATSGGSVQDFALAYMSDAEDSKGKGQRDSHSSDKHVRFGSVRDVDVELAKRAEQATAIPRVGSPQGVSSEIQEPQQLQQQQPQSQQPQPQSQPPASFVNDVPVNTAPTSSPPTVIPHRVPTPTEQYRDDEKALNAAAAREVSRELDQLMFSTQISSQPAPAETSQIPAVSSPPAAPAAPITTSFVPSALPTAPQVQAQAQAQASYTFRRTQSPPTSLTLPDREPTYVREKDRAPGATNNLSRKSSRSEIGEVPSPGIGAPTSLPFSPPSIAISGGSPISVGGAAGVDAGAGAGITTPFRTPPEYPLSSSPMLSGGGMTTTSAPTSPISPPTSLIPGTTPRMISAAAFRRQARSQTTDSGPSPGPSPPSTISSSGAVGVGGGGAVTETSPLHVRKRVPSPLSAGGGGGGSGGGEDRSPWDTQQRIPSAPVAAGGNLQDYHGGAAAGNGNGNVGGVGAGYRSVSAGQVPPTSGGYDYHSQQSQQQPHQYQSHLEQHEIQHYQEPAQTGDDHYDYISAYVNQTEGAGGHEEWK